MYPLIGFERVDGSKFFIRAEDVRGAGDLTAETATLVYANDDPTGWHCEEIKGNADGIAHAVATAIHWRHEREVIASAQIQMQLQKAKANGIATPGGIIPPRG